MLQLFHPTAQLHIKHFEFPGDPRGRQEQPIPLQLLCIHLPWEHQHSTLCSMRREWVAREWGWAPVGDAAVAMSPW